MSVIFSNKTLELSTPLKKQTSYQITNSLWKSSAVTVYYSIFWTHIVSNIKCTLDLDLFQTKQMI